MYYFLLMMIFVEKDIIDTILEVGLRIEKKEIYFIVY